MMSQKKYRIVIDTRKDNCLCPMCGHPQKITTSFRNADFEIFMFGCEECGVNSCLMLQRDD